MMLEFRENVLFECRGNISDGRAEWEFRENVLFECRGNISDGRAE